MGNFKKAAVLLLAASLLALSACGRQPEETQSDAAPDESTVSKSAAADLVQMKDQLITVVPATNSEPLYKNPGKGWILSDGSKQTSATWGIASVLYIRYRWCDIETSDGVYDFSLIDSDFALAKKHGCTFAFGIMACNPSSKRDYCTPEFVLDRDDVNSALVTVDYGNGDPFELHIPDFTDPGDGYYIKNAQLAKALAKRYGGDPDIEYVDIRCYGSWGENTHSWLGGSEGILDSARYDQGVAVDVIKKSWQSWIDAFDGTGTQLMTAWGYGCGGCSSYAIKDLYYRAAERGVGVRRDGYGDSSGCDSCESLWSNGLAASALEMPGGYAGVKSGGFKGTDLLEGPSRNRASYYPLGAYGNDGLLMYNDLKSEIAEITNQMGYYFTAGAIVFGANCGTGGSSDIYMEWTNSGNAKLYREASLAVAMLSPDGEVLDTCILENVDPRTWECERDFLTDDSVNRVVSSFSFTAEPPKGFKLAFGLMTSGSETPDIKVGNDGITDDGWYVFHDSASGAESGENILAGAKITASSAKDGTSAAGALMFADGFWCAADDGAQTLDIELATEKTVSSLTFDWGNCYASDFTIEASADGSEYKTVFTSSGELTEKCVFTPVSAKYLRINITSTAQRDVTFSGVLPYAGVNMLKSSDTLEGWYGYDSSAVTAGSGEIAMSGVKRSVMKQNLLQTFELSGAGECTLTFDALCSTDKTALTAALSYRDSSPENAKIAWYSASKRAAKNIKIAEAGAWQTYTATFNIDYSGTIEVAYLELGAVGSVTADISFKSISFTKTTDFNGERTELYDDGQSGCTVHNITAG